jgi:hypothetical protein
VAHLLNDDTVDVEITAGRQSSIGPGSQLLILLSAPNGRSPLTSQVATTLALQLGLLVAMRAEEGSCLGLQWCPLMSLIPGYPHLGGRDARCELERVTWRIPELDTGAAPDPSFIQPKYKLDRGKGTVTLYESQKDAFLKQLIRLFYQEPDRLSSTGIVAFATTQAFRQAHTRRRAEDRVVTADYEQRQHKDTFFVLMTPEVVRAAQESRLRTLDCLGSFTSMEARLRSLLGDPGDARRTAAGARALASSNSNWVKISPAVWFDLKYLGKQCPEIRSLLEPESLTIPKSASLQVPFCLQCRRCFSVGVYDAQSMSYCLPCLPMVLGYAAASRFVHCVLTFHQALAEALQARRELPPLSQRGQKTWKRRSRRRRVF